MYWYSAEPNEIFLDLDSNRATARALSVLRVAMEKKKLPIKQVFLFQSSPRKHHMIVVLRRQINTLVRLAWSLWMGNDRLRVAYVLKRYELCKTHSDLLVTKKPYHRLPDAVCECKKKHKDPKVTGRCPAMKYLLGDERSADYFARTGSAPPKVKIRIPWGNVPLEVIKEWSTE